MRPTIAIPLLLLCFLWGAQRPGRCECETPHKEGSFCRFKCPGPGMHFSEGLPIRVFIDGIDQGGWQSKRAKMEAQVVRVYVDGQLAATVDPLPDGYNYFEATLKDIKAGPHVLTAESTNFDKSISKSEPLPIVVDPPAKRDQTVELKEDLMLKGGANLAWENTAVKGNGFKVRSAPGWTGSVSVRGSFVSGLGSLTEPGIDVKTSGGSANIEKNIFEATGAVFVQADGAGVIAIKDNEFRASNLIKFVSNDPGRSPVFRASGSASGTKVFQGNRIGAGIVCFENTSGWLIGGDRDEESNVLNGPRCVIQLTNCKDSRICGNLIRHDYHGGWSQGFNLCCENCQNLVAEHNIIWHGSWPLQSFAGEFRYNLVVNSGHNWIRTLLAGSKIHHNVFIHVSHGGGINSGVWMYKDQKDVVFFNNTMDGGAPNFMAFNAPFIEISKGCGMASVRNNVFTGACVTNPVKPLLNRKDEKDSEPRIGYADYNCFFNPQSPKAELYAPGIVEGKEAGAHDIKVDPGFAQGPSAQVLIDIGEAWAGKIKVSQILAQYRERYAPGAASPLAGKGDPADGKESFIGAIGPKGCNRADDCFGKFGVVDGKTGNKP